MLILILTTGGSLMNKKLACVFSRTVIALGVAAAMTGCDDDDNTTSTPPVEEKRISFQGIEPPTSATDKASTTTSTEVVMDGTAYAIGHKVIASTNEEMPLLGDGATIRAREGETIRFGTWFDSAGEPFKAEDGSNMVCTNGSGPDFTSLLSYEKNGTTSLFAVTNMECSVGGAWITKLSQDPATGELTALATRPADFSGEFGTYVNCAGQVTPWGTHLGSEEYEPPMPDFDPDAAAYEDQTEWPWARDANVNMAWFDSDDWHDEHILGIVEYNRLTNDAATAATAGYYFGWTPEIAITSAEGDHTVKKHYAMGRFAHELAYVMPDRKTVYQSDDGANTGLFMFVADNEADLSSGHLYAAKWVQTASEGLGSADIDWVNLGHATNAEIRAALDAGVTFDVMFEQESPNDTNACPTEGFKPVNAYDHGLVCVKLKSGMFAGTEIETLASRLETRLYAGYMGATTEFRKEEGITYDAESGRLFVAMSEVARGMEDNASVEKGDDRYDRGGPNHIRLTDANLCGGVYAMDKAGGTVADTDGVDIPSSMVVNNMYGLVAGIHEGDVLDEVCDIDGIANPDNIAMIHDKGVLLIGEDTGAGNHENNFVWAYDLEDATLTRIAATPEGAETTSPYWHGPFGGWYYITLVNQHPDGVESEVGYIGPFPEE